MRGEILIYLIVILKYYIKRSNNENEETGYHYTQKTYHI